MTTQSPTLSSLIRQSGILFAIGTCLRTDILAEDIFAALADEPGEYQQTLRECQRVASIHDSLADEMEKSGKFLAFIPGIIRMTEEVSKATKSTPIFKMNEVFIAASKLVGRVAIVASSGQPIDEDGVALAADFYMLALLHEVGFPMFMALGVLARGASPRNRSTFTNLETFVKAGATLSKAMQQHCESMDWRMIQDGEINNKLTLALKNLVNSLVSDATSEFADMDMFPIDPSNVRLDVPEFEITKPSGDNHDED